MSHNIKELVEITVKNTLLKAHPIGKLWHALQTFSWSSSSTIQNGNEALQSLPVGSDMAGTHGSGYGGIWITFDASKSNAIYGKSDTVQPHTITANIWQRIS